MIRTLSWESEFFGIRVGELLVESDLNCLNANDYDFLVTKSHDEINRGIPTFTETFAEVKVVFCKKLATNIDLSLPEGIYEFDGSVHDISALYSLAFNSGKFSRFNLDPTFERSQFEAMYKLWIDNTINKSIGDGILIYCEDETIMGFISYGKKEANATVGLLSVSPAFQRRGIAKKLLQSLESLMSTTCKMIFIPTQESNVSACSFYVNSGYKVSSKTHIKHFKKI